MEPAATVRVLVRNFSSDTNQVQFSKFEIESMRDSNKWDAARKYIPEVMRNEWVLTREYDVIPPAHEAWSGFGAIPNDIEDTLLLLRLYKPGDLAFAAVIFTTPETNSLARQCPYRVISTLVSNHSLRPYTLNQAETVDWEKFRLDCEPLRRGSQAGSRYAEGAFSMEEAKSSIRTLSLISTVSLITPHPLKEL